MDAIFSKKKLIGFIAIGTAVAFLFLSLSFVAIYHFQNSKRETERLVAMERFARIKSEAELTIRENLYSLDGYVSYIETTPDVSEEQSTVFLDRLLSKRITMIRNIGILQDTTIIWNYPREGNEAAIGLDLATITGQRDDVLSVKNNRQSIFIGPIDLLQGGKGFIIRSPILKNNKYWGQISIVIDAEKYFSNIASLALETGLTIAIYKDQVAPENRIFGNETLIDRDGLFLEIKALNSTWAILAEPIGGWNYVSFMAFLFGLLAVFVSGTIGFLVFYILYTKEQLNEQASKDYLTGLFNRHALNDRFKKMSDLDKVKNELVAIMIDIDQFKQINDIHGHSKGDYVLVEIAKRLKALDMKNKTIFRLGGDEFLVLADKEAAFDDIETLREKISLKLEFADKCFFIHSSIGVSYYPKESDTLEGAIIVADQRMYQDKTRNKQ